MESQIPSNKLSIFDTQKYFCSLLSGQITLMDQVAKIMQFILIMPATNATSEYSFSALRHVKMYLRSTMKQERLNYLMLMYMHKDRTDKLCIKSSINDFDENSPY